MDGTNEVALENYVQHLFESLQLLHICKSEKVFSLPKKITIEIFTKTLLAANLVLIISELIGLKDVENGRELATRIGPISFHMTGIMKWCFCMLNIDKITSLICQLKYCHHLSFKICQSTKGILVLCYFYSNLFEIIIYP